MEVVAGLLEPDAPSRPPGQKNPCRWDYPAVLGARATANVKKRPGTAKNRRPRAGMPARAAPRSRPPPLPAGARNPWHSRPTLPAGRPSAAGSCAAPRRRARRRADAAAGGGRGGSADRPDRSRGPGCSTRSGVRSPPPPPCSAPPPRPPVEPRRRVPPAGVRPRLPRLGDAEAVARTRAPLAGAAHLPVPAGGRHDAALCWLVRRHGPRARRRGGVCEIIEGPHFGPAEIHAACG